ncbi:hypothetical protein [Lactobacillus helveticus]|uniref:Uncharacterized protein n=1 Tax=Lactobacillus helveticus TaxID=1587 RepID=A0A2X0RVQ1_LACHE|nr:hypothetical protein [Lactobacillus helveticus]EGF35172.1 hypothetical protein AAULH_12821 [Lactobacillus helveticus MTCC 5463]MBW7979683.1 hypothetical protein [Lactobacillus helveticus]MCT3404419.1 hypothetical protein [Lactobacillus helveticus]MCT3419216.1 hypothetical protein [Lactobacillus helveticus]MCT3420544.1 hypothetical protein [Lactobacillus helveticus]
MGFKIKMTVNQAIEGCSAVVIGVLTRKANPNYHNEADVSEYPKNVRLAITNDPSGVNSGQIISIKVKNADNIQVGQEFTFNSKSGARVPNGEIHFWTRNGFVQVAMKGDGFIEGN